MQEKEIVLEILTKNPETSAKMLSYKCNISIATAYRRIKEYKCGVLSSTATHRNIFLPAIVFDQFLLEVLNTGGFSSTSDLFQKFIIYFQNPEFKYQYPHATFISKRTFSRYFSASRARLDRSDSIHRLPIFMTRSRKKPKVGFFTKKKRASKLNGL
ncbi:winged helix-turn-helix domain-containing protein [Acinetobacter rathckeae]|uniref:winged helix-turn-helix domain-containing protein n=1 Tax=Acinetobacter rathckeae TaxID=2605272 RepID=UPI0018A2D4E3|nr:winged helix-turn-helix domain-containing protein [Acinetobacter rathckeae]MBF7687697.1 winged helix-turn-helix domain-containing protein [Acinetobacter rathckeae]MBF7695115.1 winged helix-turn-helix domain-containing protein [Acinetobacter rathckeae]